MNVAVKREVTGVLIYMPAAEAEQFVKNPKHAQEEVASMLRGVASMGEDNLDGMARLVMGDRALLPAPSARHMASVRRGAKAAGAASRKKASVRGEVNCPECGKPMKAGAGLASHRARMHGVPGEYRARAVAAQAKKDARA